LTNPYFFKYLFIIGTVILNSDSDSIIDVIDEMIRDFVDSGHMTKENKENVKKTLLCNHNHYQATNTEPLIRKKSTISDFFPYNSRRQSILTANEQYLTADNFSSTCTSRKNSTAFLNELNKGKNEKAFSYADADEESSVRKQNGKLSLKIIF
jgi:hypothetical protein